MLKRFLIVSVAAVCFAASALAQAPTPPPVESMNCDAMLAEMTVAGQQMNAQLDPEFATEAESMANDRNERQRSAMAAAIAPNLACMVPGLGMACMAAQQAQIEQAQEGMAENRARTDAQADRLNDSMAGLDQQRLMAMAQRFEDEDCEAPQQ